MKFGLIQLDDSLILVVRAYFEQFLTALLKITYLIKYI